MDDERMIRSLLQEAPPSAEVVAEGRRRLYAAPPRRSRWRVPGLGVAGLGLAAAATAAVFAVTTSGPPPAPVRTTPARPMSARQVLLAAAEKAASEPVGRYWHTHVISGQAYHVAKGDYVIDGARHEIDQWTARSAEDDDVFRSRFAGAIPQTAADRAAWRRAGSPKAWRVLSNGQYIRQTAAAEPWDLVRMTPAEKRGYEKLVARARKQCAGHPRGCPQQELTQAQREALADDPAALRQRLLTTSGKGGPGNVLTQAGDFLAQPGSPKLDAAVFRVLADTPGIRNAGSVTDLRGRAAIALTARSSDATGTFDTQLLLQPGTYRVLGTQTVLVARGRGPETAGMKPGTVYAEQLFLEMGWTDSAPR
ncbi:CU044_5270 family protein [Actinoallomurus soli]|uniref:CU044_5270 family protein n=1 Tax=Actinoallomurus soli TaxID=2952535 RepID=UPI0020920A19|nr:CU044_5270 family protein [Actinoallomurus soli]MCO5968578.1 CU044_5270 family protein [Actinoallomurus soli]